MSLSDRLHAAAQERAGIRTVDPSSLLAEPEVATRELTVILGAHIPVATVEPDPDADADAICPSCGRTGELGILDLARQTTDWSCIACGTLWRIATPASAAAHLR